MSYKNTVRSLLAILAMSGLAACSSNSGGSVEPGPSALSPAAEQTEVITLADVKATSVRDARGTVLSVEAASIPGNFGAVNKAMIVRTTKDNVTRFDVELGAGNASVAKFAGTDLAKLMPAAEGLAAYASAVSASPTQLKEFTVVFADGSSVLYAVGAEQKQEQPKQEQPKQEQPKQEQPKQEEPKQEQPKQEQPKQEEPKQEQPKQEEPKQEQPKQEQPKQEEPKQEQPKQEQPKQEEPKQEQPKQEQPKQEEPKQEQPKQETPKQGGTAQG